MEVFIWKRRQVTRIAEGCITSNSSVLIRVLLRLEEAIPGSSAHCFRAFPERLCNHSADHIILKMDNYSSGEIKEEEKRPKIHQQLCFFFVFFCWLVESGTFQSSCFCLFWRSTCWLDVFILSSGGLTLLFKKIEYTKKKLAACSSP